MNQYHRRKARLTSFLKKALKPIFAICALAPVLAPQHAAATTPPNYFWDANAGTGGTGTWDTTTANWGTAANTPPSTTWVNGSNTALFSSSTAGTVTIGNGVNITAQNLTFTVTGYTVTDNAGGGGTGTLTLTGASTITVNPGVTAAVAAVLNDATTTDSLTFTGGGTVQLSGANAGAYLGSLITINANTTVQAEVTSNLFAPALPVTSAFVVNGTLDLNGTSQTIASLAGTNTAAAVTNSNTGAYATLTVGVNAYPGEASSFTYAGTITDSTTTIETVNTANPNGTAPNGALGLIVSSPAGNNVTLILTNPGNTYHGLTIVADAGNPSTLKALAAGVFSPNSIFVVGAGGTLDLGGFNQTIAGLSTTTGTPDTGTVTNNGGSAATLTVGNSTLATGVTNALISGVSIQDGTSALAFTKTGGYTQVLTGNNTYSGATLISAGVLTAGSATAFSAVSLYTVNGTLDLNGYNTTVGSLSGSGTVLNGIAGDPDSGTATTATLTAGSFSTAATTFSGTLNNGSVGPLALTKTGIGILTLTNGTNGYTGGTNINGGVLSFVGGALSTGLVTFTGNSTLQYQPGNTQDTSLVNGIKINNLVTATIDTDGNNVTYSTAFQGASTGALTKTGLGTLSLAAANVYSGGTNINQGTLNFISGAEGTGAVTFTGNSTLQWATGNTQDVSSTQSGALTINPGVTATFDTNGNNVTFANSLSTGAGAGVTKTGLGVLQLKGTNTYNGVTTVNNGTLQAGSTTAFSPNSAFTVLAPGILDLHGFNNSIGSLAGTGTVTNKGTAGAILTEGLNNTSTTFSGVIQDGTAPTALITSGTGALTLSSPNTYSGGTTINTGSTIFVGNPTALGGGNVVNNGVLAAASSTSATNIQVGGSYTQGGSGELDLRIGGTATGTFDRLSVTGPASVSGKLSVSSLNGFTPKAGNSIPVITASSVTGTFGTVSGNLSNLPLLKLTVTYLSNEVLLNFGQGSFVIPPTVMINNKPVHIYLSPNEKAVATALDHVSSSSNLVRILDSFPIQALPGAYDLIGPAEYGAIYEISRSAAKMEAATIENRLDEVHAVAFRTGAPGPTGSLDDKDSKASKEVIPPPEDRLSVFANGSGEFVSVGDTSNAKGYNFDSGGATVGVDYRFTDHFLAGVLLNYTGSTVDLINNGRLDANAFRGGVYASLFGGGAYVNGFVGGAYSDYNMTRQGLGGTVRGDTSGGDFNALIATGYDFHAGGFTYGPVGSFQYTYSGLDSFNESGSLAPLHINAGHGDSLLTNLGARATYECHIGNMVLVPEVRATWQHEYGDVFDEVSASMLLGSPAFTVTSSPIGRDSLVLNAGFTLRLTPNMSTYAFYDGELARSNYQANNLLVGFRASF